MKKVRKEPKMEELHRFEFANHPLSALETKSQGDLKAQQSIQNDGSAVRV